MSLKNAPGNSAEIRPYKLEEVMLDGAPAWAAVFQEVKGGRYWLGATDREEAEVEVRQAERQSEFRAL